MNKRWSTPLIIVQFLGTYPFKWQIFWFLWTLLVSSIKHVSVKKSRSHVVVVGSALAEICVIMLASKEGDEVDWRSVPTLRTEVSRMGLAPSPLSRRVSVVKRPAGIWQRRLGTGRVEWWKQSSNVKIDDSDAHCNKNSALAQIGNSAENYSTSPEFLDACCIQ